MGLIIVDTSVWVDYFRGIQSHQTKLLANLLANTNRVTITPTVLQETLQGIRDDSQFTQIRESLLVCIILRLDPTEAAIEAAQLYRMLRKKGVTIRKPNDCLTAYYGLFHDVPILHNDIDFVQIARYTALKMVPTEDKQ